MEVCIRVERWDYHICRSAVQEYVFSFLCNPNTRRYCKQDVLWRQHVLTLGEIRNTKIFIYNLSSLRPSTTCTVYTNFAFFFQFQLQRHFGFQFAWILFFFTYCNSNLSGIREFYSRSVYNTFCVNWKINSVQRCSVKLCLWLTPIYV